MRKSIFPRIAMLLLAGTILIASSCSSGFKGPKKNRAHHGKKGLAPSMGN